MKKKINLLFGIELYYSGVVGLLCLCSDKWIIHFFIKDKEDMFWGFAYEDYTGWKEYGLGPFALILWE